MITEAVANWFLGAAAWLVGLIPPLPESVTGAVGGFDGRVDQIVAQVSKLAPVVPFDAIGASLGLLWALLGFALVMQVSRIVLSLVTLGGGSV